MKSKSGSGTKKNNSAIPAPFIKGVGIDIEDVMRFRSRKSRDNDFFYKKIFTDHEMRYCMSKPDPYPHFTARFCAKEAVSKALNRTLFRLKDIEVINDQDGRPRIRINEKKIDHTIALSLSHTKKYAIAIALVL